MDESEIKNKLAIYSPCDGMVYSIAKLNDGVFSTKTLGDGVYFIPKNGDFYSPLKSAKIALVAETKHAISFTTDNVSLLMHIGLETTTMNGSPFDIRVNVNDTVGLDSLLCKVNLQAITDKKISTATPLVIDPASKFTGFQLADKFVNNHEVKRGELIGYAFALAKENVTEKSNSVKTEMNQNMDDVTDYISPQKKAAQNIYTAIGGGENFSDFTHCMTRLRFTIKNKQHVNEAAIKKVPCVKDIHWNGPQIQIIIGSEVVKVYDEFKDVIKAESASSTHTLYYTNTGSKLGADKVPWSKKIFTTISSVVFPILPALMVVGIVKAIYGILSMPQVGVLDDVNGWMMMGKTPDPGTGYYKPSVISYLLFVISDAPVLFFGLFFFISVVRFLKGNTFVATTIALILCAPIIYTIFPPYGSIMFNFGWKYFELPGVVIRGGYQVMPQQVGIFNMSLNIFVMIPSAIFYVYFDKWVKRWVPTCVSFIFQHAISVVGTVIVTLTAINVVMSIVSYIVAIAAVSLSAIPYGIGLGFFSLLWQPLVITGTHMAVGLPLALQLVSTPPIPSSILIGEQYAALAQCGAGFAIATRTKDMNTRNLALNTTPLAILGITEPIMYGVTLPKGRPFLLACLASGISGFITGALGANVCSVAGGAGILVIPALIPSAKQITEFHINLVNNVIFGTLGLIIAFGLAYLFVFFSYADFKSINKQTKSVGNLIKHYYKNALAKNVKFNLNNWKKVETDLVQLDKLVNSEASKKVFGKRLNNLSDLTRIETALAKITNKEEKIKESLSKKAIFYKKHGNEAKVTLINKQFKNVNFVNQKNPLLKRSEKINNEGKATIAAMNELKQKYLLLAKQTVDDAINCFNDQKLAALTINYENSFNAIDIAFDQTEVLPNAFFIPKNKAKKAVNAQVK